MHSTMTVDQTSAPTKSPAAGLTDQPSALPWVCRNIRLMHCLERIALHLNLADVPVMVLKGAALNMTVYDRPDQRLMRDVDIMVRPEHAAEALAVLERAGCRQQRHWVRQDFFPRYYFETEFSDGELYPVTIDLHVRPFRPLRYVKLISDAAMWDHAAPMRLGEAEVYLPSAEDMLLHLAVHCAFHNEDRPKWLEDIQRWIDARAEQIDWGRFVARAGQWHLHGAVLRGMALVEAEHGTLLPRHVRQALEEMPLGWRDRLVLAQAPRDEQHPVAHVAAAMLTTPDWRLVGGFLRSLLIPDQRHMAEWYSYRHPGWLATAHLLRLLSPLANRLRFAWRWAVRVELQDGDDDRPSLIARREIVPGQLIGRFSVMEGGDSSRYAISLQTPDGRLRHCTMQGKWRYVRVSPQPNARLEALKLVALRRIRPGDPITIAPERISRIPADAYDPGQADACGMRQIPA